MWPSSRITTLRLRLILYVIVALVPLIILNLLSQWDVRRLRREAVVSNSLSIASGTAAAVETFLDNARDAQYAAALSFAGGRIPLDHASAYLAAMRAVDPHYVFLVVLNREGRVIASDSQRRVGEDYSQHPWFREMVRGQEVMYVSGLFPISGDTGAFIVTVGVRERGRFRLALAGAVRPAALQRIVTPDGPGEAHAGILDDRGHVIASGFAELRGKPLLHDRSYVPGFDAALHGRRSSFVNWRDPIDGVVKIGATAPVRNGPWAVTYMQPQELTMKPVTDAQTRDMVALLAFAALSLLVAWFFGGHITRPVRQLTQDAAQVAAGDLSTRSRITRRDEIGQLAASFNVMASNLETFYRVSQKATSVLDMQTLLDSIATEICRSTGFDLCAVGLLSEQGDYLYFAGTSGFQADDIRRARIAVGTRICGAAVAEKRPIVVENCESLEKACREYLTPEGARSGVAVPILSGEEAIGVLTVYSRTPRVISDLEVRLLTAIATFVSIGITNARTYEHEHRIAVTLQRSFLPDIPERVGSFEIGRLYRPALGEAEVGGDFYDFFPIDSNRYGVVIGDVAGKGISAAVTAVMGLYMLRAFASEDTDPASVLRRLNDALSRQAEYGSFITVLYGILDQTSNSMRFASAGHEPPLFYSRERREAQWLFTPGRVAGAIPGGDYESETIQFDQHDCLLLYTDGVVDARRNGEFFEQSRLEAAALDHADVESAQQLLDAILQSVISFSDGKLRDDIAMLAIRRTDQSASE